MFYNVLKGGLQLCFLVLVDEVLASYMVAEFKTDPSGEHFTVVHAAWLTTHSVAGNLIGHF